MTKYRQVGGRLGAYIRANNPSTQQIQGLLADLLAGDPLLPTMREVVNSHLFLALHPHAGSGGGGVQRDALLQDLAQRYVPAVLSQVGQLLNGVLDYSHGNTSQASREGMSPAPNQPGRNQDVQLDAISQKYDQVLKELTEIKLAARDSQTYSETQQVKSHGKSSNLASGALVAIVAIFGTAIAVLLSQSDRIKSPAQSDNNIEAKTQSIDTTEPKPSTQGQFAESTPTENNNPGCWFQKTSGGDLTKMNCSIYARRNSNNHLVYDIKELPEGLERTVVLWKGGRVEVLLRGQRYEGSWYTDSDKDIRVSLASGEFAFTPVAESGDRDRRADEIFWQRYPSLRGQKLQSMDDRLAEEWIQIRKSLE